MSEIQIFNNEEFEVGIRERNGVLEFKADTIAKSLGFIQYKNSKEYIRWTTVNGYLTDVGFSQEVGKDDFIPEAYVYLLAMKSKNDVAIKFQQWLAFEVLPSIRKHGAYMTPQTIEETLNNPDFIIGLATKLKEEKEARIKAEKEIEFKNNIIEIQQPKVNMYDDFMGTDALYSVSDVARVFGIKDLGRNNFYKYLRNNKILMTHLYNGNAGINHFTAYAQYVNTNQYFKHRSRLMGSTGLKQNVAMFTPIGIEFIYKRLIKDGYIIEKTIQDVVSDLIEE